MPLRHLIVLIINAHPQDVKPRDALIRKTSLLRDRSNCARGQAAQAKRRSRLCRHTPLRDMRQQGTRAPGVREPPRFAPNADSDRSPLHDVIQHASSAAGRGREFLFTSGRTTTRATPVDHHICHSKRQTRATSKSRRHHRHNITPIWWSQTGSNRRPPACKAGALPAELWPQKSITSCLQSATRA